MCSPPPLPLPLPPAQVSEVKKSGDQLTLNLVPHVEGGVTQEMGGVDCLLWAVGRDANLVNLSFEKTGTAPPPNGDRKWVWFPIH